MVRDEIRSDAWDARISRSALRMWGKCATVDALMLIIARWTPMVMLILVVAEANGLFLAPNDTKYAQLDAGIGVVAAVVSRAVNGVVANFVRRPRPYEEHGILTPFLRGTGSAYPSNHATGAFALATAAAGIPGYFGVLLFLACAVALARVYILVHHATDVLAAALHGSFVSLLFLWGYYAFWGFIR